MKIDLSKVFYYINSDSKKDNFNLHLFFTFAQSTLFNHFIK